MFLQNINPLTKLIHAPSMQADMIGAVKEPNSASTPKKALIFAIYAAAVMSMRDEDCISEFGEPRKALWEKYISATQGLLVAANFMKSRSLILLQAFTIYIVSILRPILAARVISGSDNQPS